MGSGIRFTRAVISNIAQVVLLVIVAPFLAVIVRLIAPQSASDLAFQLADYIPFFEMWVSLLKDLFQVNISSLNPVFNILADLCKAIIIALVVKFACFVHITAELRGLPILATVLGTVVAMLLTSVIAASFGGIVTMVMYLGVIVIMLIGMKIALSSVFSSLHTSMSSAIYGAVFSGICAVCSTGYVTIMALILSGRITNPGLAVAGILLATALEILVALLMYVEAKIRDQQKVTAGSTKSW